MVTSKSTEFLLSKDHVRERFRLMSLGAAVAAAAVAFVWLKQPIVGFWPPIAGFAAALSIFGYGYWQMHRASADRAPRLVISPEGISAKALGGRLVPWQQISRTIVRKQRNKREAALIIDVTSEAEAGLQILKRAQGRMNSLIYGGELVVPIGSLDGGHAAVVQALRRANPSVRVEER
jgi:hypothetical protein